MTTLKRVAVEVTEVGDPLDFAVIADIIESVRMRLYPPGGGTLDGAHRSVPCSPGPSARGRGGSGSSGELSGPRGGVSTMPKSSATAVPAYCATLPRTEASVAKARRLVSASLRVWSLEACDATACLVISELVTNAVRHARLAAVLVRVSRVGPRRVRVAVVDLARTPPTLINAGVNDESGRGLATVAAVSTAWGVDALPWGKRVWAECTVPLDDS